MPKSEVMPIGKLTVYGLDEMKKNSRKAVANWLRKQADFIEKGGEKCSRRFVARYLPVKRGSKEEKTE